MVSAIASVCFLIACAAHGLKLDGPTSAPLGHGSGPVSPSGEASRLPSRKERYVAAKKSKKHTQEVPPLSRKERYVAAKKSRHLHKFKATPIFKTKKSNHSVTSSHKVQPKPTPNLKPRHVASQVRPDIQTGTVNHSDPYSCLPNFTLMARVYSAAEDELNNFLLPSYDTFWPSKSLWPNSRLKLMWDKESTWDHAAAWRTLKRWKFLTNHYEKKPANGTLCSAMRTTGYARQQYSNFIVDQTLEDDLRDDEYVGFSDSDTFFTTAVLPEELFDWDSDQLKWKPRVFGYNSCCVDWMNTTSRVLSSSGRRAGQFMTVYGFPIILKVKHLKVIRNLITSKGDFASPSWDVTFRKICDTGSYSQFDIMMNVIWNSPLQDEYSWYLRDQRDSQSHAFRQGVASSDESVLSKNDFQRPKISIMEHSSHKKTTTQNVYQYVCTYDHLDPLDPIVKKYCSGLSVDKLTEMRRDHFVDALSTAKKYEDNRENAPSDEDMWHSLKQHTDRVYLHKQAFSWLK